MGYGVKVEVWGDYALFTRPETKVERVSYDVITPSAARGLMESIYWKPAIKWIIDRIYVCNPIEFTNVRRNEVKSKLLASNAKAAMTGAAEVNPIYTSENIQQRASLVLKNVRYVIAAHFILTDKVGEGDTAEKHYNIALRRLRTGQCFHQPCFGCREFPAHFKLFEGDAADKAIHESRELGYMLYDTDFSDPDNFEHLFFRAALKDGVVHLENCEVVR
jgi:CRISPR-associated protein Cas5d